MKTSLLALSLALVSFAASARTVRSSVESDWRSKSGFGAGYEIGTSTTAFDHETECAAIKADNWCTPFKDLAFIYPICLMTRQNTLNAICSVKGSEYDARAWASASAQIFGSGKKEIAKVEAYATAAPTLNKAGMTLTVAGHKLFDPSVSTSASLTFAYPVEFLSATKTYMVGPVPVLVTAELTGALGATLSGQFGTSTVTLGASPFISTDATLGAGVGTKFASAGIEGSIEVVKVSLPATAAITFTGGRSFDWALDLALEVDALSGEIALVAKLFGEVVGELTIFEWEGLSWHWDLAATNGSASF